MHLFLVGLVCFPPKAMRRVQMKRETKKTGEADADTRATRPGSLASFALALSFAFRFHRLAYFGCLSALSLLLLCFAAAAGWNYTLYQSIPRDIIATGQPTSRPAHHTSHTHSAQLLRWTLSRQSNQSTTTITRSTSHSPPLIPSIYHPLIYKSWCESFPLPVSSSSSSSSSPAPHSSCGSCFTWLHHSLCVVLCLFEHCIVSLSAPSQHGSYVTTITQTHTSKSHTHTYYTYTHLY